MSIGNAIMVAIGGALGCLGRYGIAQIGTFDSDKHYYTLIANLIGCLAIGIVWALLNHISASRCWHLLIITGFLGGFTTFSAFALDTMHLIEGGQMLRSAIYVGVSVIGGLALCGFGLWITDRLLKAFGG